MSAFLGPIHFWLYEKIGFQEKLTAELARAAREAGWLPEGDGLFDRCVREELPPLDGAIDVGNIHGWLQGRIEDAETRYAALMGGLLKGDPARRETLLKRAFEFGGKNPVEAGASPADAYKKFDDTFLNGMPCDRMNAISEREDDRLAWEQAADIHGKYWEKAGAPAEVYYEVRGQVMEGMLKGSGLSLSSPASGKWEIRR